MGNIPRQQGFYEKAPDTERSRRVTVYLFAEAGTQHKGNVTAYAEKFTGESVARHMLGMVMSVMTRSISWWLERK
jgi:hypothetical protein